MITLRRSPMATCLLLALFWNSNIQAQPTRINVGYSAISGNALPAWIAKDAGIFEKNGLDVQLVYFTGGTTAVMALISADTHSLTWLGQLWSIPFWRVRMLR